MSFRTRFDLLPGLQRNFRKEIVQYHQISFFGREQRLLRGNVRQVFVALLPGSGSKRERPGRGEESFS